VTCRATHPGDRWRPATLRRRSRAQIGSAGRPGWCERYCRGASGSDNEAISGTAAETGGLRDRH
jgi:hypothetical protein